MSKQHYSLSNYRAERSIGYLIKRAHSMMLDEVESIIGTQGFTYLQFVVLVSLRDGLAVNPKDICSRYRHDSGALTRVIDQLAERGLLERVRGCRDRRTVELQLTAAGREAIERLIPCVIDKLNLALEEFTSAEFEEFIRLLAKLNHRLQALVEPEATNPSP